MSVSATQQLTLPAGAWKVDPSHSSVEFQVKHMGIATVKGVFGEFEGTLEIPSDDRAPHAHGTVRTASVDTREPQRDEHLRSADFFDAASHPELRFSSTSIRPVDEDTFLIVGELTIHGVTREVELEATLHGTDTDPWGNERVAVEAVGQIRRSDFDMRFNQALGSGNALVADKVKVLLDVSAVRVEA